MNNMQTATAKLIHFAAKAGKALPLTPIANADFDYKPSNDNEYTVGFAKKAMLPNDIDTKTYYIAGYSENNPARGVIDPQYCHALWLEDLTGRGGILMFSLDIVGLLNRDVMVIRQRLKSFCKQTNCREVFVFSTHNHAGIDTMGIWGKLPFSGKSSKFMDILFNACSECAVLAYQNRKPGRLLLSRIQVPDMQEDIRTPVVYSDILTRLRFVPKDNSNEVWFINFASHSESLQGCNHLVSADFPAYLREYIKTQINAEVFYCVGAVGGMISMKLIDEKRLRTEHRLLESTRNIGYRLAQYALQNAKEDVITGGIHFIRQEFYCPVENPVLTLACKIGLLNADRYRSDEKENYGYLKSEMTYLEIGDLTVLMLPCELFPELAYGGYLTEATSAQGLSEQINPVPLTKIAQNDKLMIIGLANDELGYVIPPNDFLLNPEHPYTDKAIDRLGRRHYEETNSMGPKTAGMMADTFAKMLDTVNRTKKSNKSKNIQEELL